MMRQRKEYEPWQQKGICYNCGSSATTVDHIPSKVLLDEPYPANLEVVPCCLSCNLSFSRDEEYAAMLIECIKHQTTNPCHFDRKKVIKILQSSPNLINAVEKSLNRDIFGNLWISIDDVRFRNFVMKLVKAHLRNELCIIPYDIEHTHIPYARLSDMNDEMRSEFFAPQKIGIIPEVGSRCLEDLLFINGSVYNHWHTYQKGSYSYFVSVDRKDVRILIQDFLVIQVILK